MRPADVTPDILTAILTDRDAGLAYRPLAEKYGLSLGTTMRIIARREIFPARHPRKKRVNPWSPKIALGRLPESFPAYWRDQPSIKSPRALILSGPTVSLRVRKRQLVIFDAGRETAYTPGETRFASLLIEAPGSHVTGEALAWLDRQNIGLIVANGRDIIPVLPPERDGKVRLRIAQYTAFKNPLAIAKAIVAQKLLSGMEQDMLAKEEVATCLSHVHVAPDINALHMIEGRAAVSYFAMFENVLKFRAMGKEWPDNWGAYPGRQSPLGGPTARNALHPVNAVLNYAYTIAASQLERALAARGFDTAIGFLHGIRDGRASIAWDALELMRASIDSRILSLLASRPWRYQDFTFTRQGIVRLSPATARIAASRAFATKRELEQACQWMEDQIMRATRGL
jgi:CRISPR-associated protein Cas1